MVGLVAVNSIVGVADYYVNPLEADGESVPGVSLLGDEARFQFRKEASGLTYQILNSTNFFDWAEIVLTEQSDGASL